MLHMGYSSPSVIALVYHFTSLYKKVDSIQALFVQYDVN